MKGDMPGLSVPEYTAISGASKEVDPPDPSKTSRRCLSEASDQRGFEARRSCSSQSEFQILTRSPQYPTVQSPERLGKDMEGGQQHMAHQQPQEAGVIATGEKSREAPLTDQSMRMAFESNSANSSPLIMAGPESEALAPTGHAKQEGESVDRPRFSATTKTKYEELDDLLDSFEGDKVEVVKMSGEAPKWPTMHSILNLDALFAGKKILAASIVPGAIRTQQYRKAKRSKGKKSVESSPSKLTPPHCLNVLHTSEDPSGMPEPAKDEKEMEENVQEDAKDDGASKFEGTNEQETESVAEKGLETAGDGQEESLGGVSKQKVIISGLHHPKVDVTSRAKSCEAEGNRVDVERTGVAASKRSSATEVEEVASSPRSIVQDAKLEEAGTVEKEHLAVEEKIVTTFSFEEVASSPKSTGDGGIVDLGANGAPFPDMDEQVYLHGTERERVEELPNTNSHTLSSTSIHLGDCRGDHPNPDVTHRAKECEGKAVEVMVKQAAKEITNPVFLGSSKRTAEGGDGWMMADQKGRSNRQNVTSRCKVQLNASSNSAGYGSTTMR
ncbi:unnamed protein product [Caenorhabditis brenneri]